MFEQIIHALLAGQFICEFRHPALYEFLQGEEQRVHVTQWVEAIGYRLSRLGEQGAYFLSSGNIDADRRIGIRKQFKDIKSEQWPRMQFLMTVQHALENDLFLTPGSLIELPNLVDRISSSPKLTDDFRTVLPYLIGARVSTSLHDNLKRTLDGMCSDGYLAMRNVEREIYMVTGKIDYLHQVIEFLLDNEPSVIQAEATTQPELEANTDPAEDN